MRQIKSEQRRERFAIEYGESFNRAINGGATRTGAIDTNEARLQKNGCRENPRSPHSLAGDQ